IERHGGAVLELDGLDLTMRADDARDWTGVHLYAETVERLIRPIRHVRLLPVGQNSELVGPGEHFHAERGDLSPPADHPDSQVCHAGPIAVGAVPDTGAVALLQAGN